MSYRIECCGRRLLVFIAALCLLSCLPSAWADSLRPNIVLMMADDMGMGDTSAYQDFTGNSDDDQVHTPAMQRLANMGVRFTDAHTPSSRCSPTRYALLTGRYPWRNRLKHWVLFGVQGDPMIERDRPTIATLLKKSGYRTGLFGKWHVGLRYRQSDGRPADGWIDADLTQPMFDTPADHGFDVCRFTSRSHGTSGPSPRNKKKPNSPHQTVGPGHIDGRTVLAATSNGKQLKTDGPDAYLLNKLGSRHSDHAIEFLSEHLAGAAHAAKPFFLYYPSNSNHGPHTPDKAIGGEPVAGASKSVSGKSMTNRSDYVYENDVALGRLIDFLSDNDDPRRPGEKLISNTIVIFTSDNGAEIKAKTATGPFRSHKGSVYEGGHRVPFLVAWPRGGVGDGNGETEGGSSEVLIGLQDMFATFAEVVGRPLPDLAGGEKGGEDSVSVLDAWRGKRVVNRPMMYHDHNEAKEDRAVSAIRFDDPVINGKTVSGKWKLFLDPSLLRSGTVKAIELYDLATDSRETVDRLSDRETFAVARHLSDLARLHRTVGGHRLAALASNKRFRLDFRAKRDSNGQAQQIVGLATRFSGASGTQTVSFGKGADTVTATIVAARNGERLDRATFNVNPRGLGIDGGQFEQVDSGEAIVVSFDRDVIVESAAIVAGNGSCGGYYQVGEGSPMAIYCTDADIDAQDQSGQLSDIGVIKVGTTLRLDSRPHYGVEEPGAWRLEALTVRLLK